MTIRMNLASATATAVSALLVIATPALAKVARCVIKTSDGAYTGACRFTRTNGGSFSVTPIGRTDFFNHGRDDPGVTVINVDIDGANAAVSGLTTSGTNSSWGPASRSHADGACWIGEDFSVCVY